MQPIIHNPMIASVYILEHSLLIVNDAWNHESITQAHHAHRQERFLAASSDN